MSLNAAFGVDPLFQDTIHRVLYERVDREALEPRARIVMGMYLTSVVNLYAQLHREVEEEVLPPEALEFLQLRLFATPFFRASWPHL